MKYLRYVSRAFQLANLLAVYVPMIMEDGKITMKELVELATQVCEIGGWKMEISIPQKLKDIKLDASVE